nr:transposase, MuDR, MULE transposase domain protein [Tanacetum cinerariifolium]
MYKSLKLVSSEDAGTDDDDDVDEDFLVDEENEIVEPDVDVHLFGISMDLLFDNIGVTNLVSDDFLEGEDMDVINADGFDSDPGNDEETNYKKRSLAKLRIEMKGVINANGQWKYSFYTSQKFTTPKEAKDKVYLHYIESRRNLKLYKNENVRIRERCNGKVLVFTMSQGQVLVAVELDLNNGSYPLAYALAEAKSRAEFDLLLNNNYDVFNGKIVGAGQDGSGGSGAGAVIGLPTVASEGGAFGLGGAGVSSQGSSHSRWTKRIGLGGGGYLRDYVRLVAKTDDGGLGSDGYLTDYVSVVGGTDGGDSVSELLIPTPWSDESKNKKRKKGTNIMKDKVNQEHMCKEEMTLNNNIGKQIGDFVDMPSEVVKQGMDANVPDKIDGAKGERVPNHVVKKGNLEFLVCKEVVNLGVNELVDKERPLKRKRMYAE